MGKYRIIKETKQKTKTSKYYIQKYGKFLKWEWWTKLTRRVPCYGIEVDLDFETYKEAEKALDLITEGTDTEIILHAQHRK